MRLLRNTLIAVMLAIPAGYALGTCTADHHPSIDSTTTTTEPRLPR